MASLTGRYERGEEPENHTPELSGTCTSFGSWRGRQPPRGVAAGRGQRAGMRPPGCPAVPGRRGNGRGRGTRVGPFPAVRRGDLAAARRVPDPAGRRVPRRPARGRRAVAAAAGLPGAAPAGGRRFGHRRLPRPRSRPGAGGGGGPRRGTPARRAAGRGGGPAGGGRPGRAGGRRGRRRRPPPHRRQPVLRSAGAVAAEGRAGRHPARRARGAGGEVRRPARRVRGGPERLPVPARATPPCSGCASWRAWPACSPGTGSTCRAHGRWPPGR